MREDRQGCQKQTGFFLIKSNIYSLFITSSCQILKNILLSNNINNEELNNPLFKQTEPGELLSNIGNNLNNQYNQLEPGELTNNIGNNDLDEPQYTQLDPGELTNNIGNNDLNETRFEQLEPGELTININNKNLEEPRFEQLNPGELIYKIHVFLI